MKSNIIFSRFSPNALFMFATGLAGAVVLVATISMFAAANKSASQPVASAEKPQQVYSTALNGKYLASGPSYLVTADQPGSYAPALAPEIQIDGDFAFQAQVSIQGDSGGLLFRMSQGQGDRFSVGTDGTYKLANSQGTLLSGTSQAIYTGQKAVNLLSAVVQGQEIYLYANGQFLAKAQDAVTKNTGQVGCQALDVSQKTSVNCKNVVVYSSTSFVVKPSPIPALPMAPPPPPPAPPSSSGGGNGSGGGSGSGGSGPGGGTQEAQIAQGVFTKLNQDRVAAGLQPLKWSTALVASAHQHNLAMANANLMEHQVPGEPKLGPRISAQGISWLYVEENIGWTTDKSLNGALGLHHHMMSEVPPDDGHRTNILSPNVNYIGIDIVFDTVNNKLWLTEDFSDAS